MFRISPNRDQKCVFILSRQQNHVQACRINSYLAKQISQHVSHEESELIALPCVHFATALLTLSQVCRELCALFCMLSGALMQTQKRRRVNFIRGNTNENSCTPRSGAVLLLPELGIQCRRHHFLFPRTCFCCCKPAIAYALVSSERFALLSHKSCRGAGQCSFLVYSAWRFFATRNSRNLIICIKIF